MRTTILLAALLLAAPALADDGFLVVVHPSNPVARLGKADASKLFLKKTTRWGGGQAVQPVETADERVRGLFAEKVHGKSLNAVRSYWNQQIFSGRDVPPLEKAGDAAVLAYVRANPGAVGVVSAGADVSGAKVVPVKD